ncbi:MAG: (2Fe-2S)-binding protein [Gammaproteobacteria bacterium]|jgi:bacterioferritin-associated ferredoxin|nr:(2Fe-2S)-binding protein [Gammaproteobacteria bacterium]MBP6052422.1 (2Fe-2S)-binding protein [Pseudomonadales bacterium]MBK6583162.1 (2Fe-2S)-binding protein [Gammaproteobacteria bacterium]MBK7170626.1 (2Fe-2S)-binding protein [Gammaproteobacteria bacterium]MBK7519296.1 (2Fe-2S)-binding protein [Gammaproteobacteria bacterium]
MYVCICNAVTESDIADAVKHGVRTMAQLEETLLVSTCCGKCRDAAIECLERNRPAPSLAIATSA